MAREPAIIQDTVELAKIRVATTTRDDLRALSRRTGASMTWLRRRALEDYISRRNTELNDAP